MKITPAMLAALARGDVKNFEAASTPGGIEAQEKAGQRDMVEGYTLPRDIQGITRDEMTELGFVFDAEPDKGLFVRCDLPAGWKKVATDHDMWSDLVDDKGHKRASIFYKAAFYDQRSFMRWESSPPLPEPQNSARPEAKAPTPPTPSTEP